MAAVADRWAPFGTTIFAEITALAIEHRAINLGQGFPDFEGPEVIKAAAQRAIADGHNQYARSRGELPLVEAVARHRQHFYGQTFDPLTEVTVTAGATEGLAAAFLGLVNPGDEVILFEPFYDSYPAGVAMAGGVPRYCTLRFPEEAGGAFTFDDDELAACFTDKTRLLVLNSPHNPSGKVFTRAELERIRDLVVEHDCMVLADEVYEHLTFDDAEHIPIATLPGMRERTLTVGSAGKTFSFTGWKIGWLTGTAALVSAAQAAHQFLTYAQATPLQHAVAAALHEAIDGSYLSEFRAAYAARRSYLLEALTEAGFVCARTEGTYFTLTDFSRLADVDDRTFARELIEQVGVAAIPPSAFYKQNVAAGQRLMRFAFCKQLETLQKAGEALAALSSRR
jgi:N-succinyldiaminopimelate aminotransferase